MNRTSGAVRGRELITPSYSILQPGPGEGRIRLYKGSYHTQGFREIKFGIPVIRLQDLNGTPAVIIVRLEEVKEIFLHPDQMYHTTNRGPMITHVNALQYITWKDGIWQFTSESLESIALRLSRYYGVDIHCDEKTAVKSCTGKLILFDDVDKTLRIIEEIFGVRYETNQNEIIISMNP